MRRMLKQATFGAVSQIPGRAHQRVKIVEPVLIELVACFPNLPVQAVVQNFWRNCMKSQSIGKVPQHKACCPDRMHRESGVLGCCV